MHRHKKNIVFLFVFLLLAPLSYQSIHVIEHLSDDDPVHLSADTELIIVTDSKGCPVCSYEFATFLPYVCFLTSLCEEVHIEQILPETDNHIYSYTGQNISLRAPPSQC